jgi:hypothetical protein
VKNRFQNVPFKFNLQRYSTGRSRSPLGSSPLCSPPRVSPGPGPGTGTGTPGTTTSVTGTGTGTGTPGTGIPGTGIPG